MIVGVIPVRMGSSRFPGKPLAPIAGRPMVEHVYVRSARCALLDRVVIATPDPEIAEAVARFDGQVVMTAPTHERATDRVAEAVERLGADVVAMIQGDEPLVRPEMIEAALRPVLDDPTIFCTNLIEPIASADEFMNPNTIKVVRNRRGDAVYFSREPIPTAQKLGFAAIPAFKQVCIMGFRRERLRQFAQLSPMPLEQAESIDMLRLIEHGQIVRLVETPFRTQSVDAPEDILTVERLMAQERRALSAVAR